MKDELEQKKFYYPNGRLEAERSYKNGIPHGYHREWHENGILASEVNYSNGAPEGVGKQWDENGNLLFSYSICNGTGIQKAWFGNQGIWAEVSWLNGRMTGRQRTYRIDDGTVIGDTFWIENKNVSRKKYFNACETNPDLPLYEKESNKPCKIKPSMNEGRNNNNNNGISSFVSDLLASSGAYEALSWLEGKAVPKRTLGENEETEASIDFVKSLYDIGAKKVWVFDVDDYGDEGQNSGKLIVELPKNPDQRLKLFEICGDIANNLGYDAEVDTNQEAIFLMLD